MLSNNILSNRRLTREMSMEEWERTNSTELNIIYNILKKDSENEGMFAYLTYDKFIEFCYNVSSKEISNNFERVLSRNN